MKGERSDYVDLGCILLKPVAGVAVRMDLDEQSQRPRALNIDYKDGSVQLQAFSAPKSSGLWDDVRRELAEGLRRDGGQATVPKAHWACRSTPSSTPPRPRAAPVIVWPASSVSTDRVGSSARCTRVGLPCRPRPRRSSTTSFVPW